MKPKLIAVALVGLLSVLPAWAKKGEPKFKSMEVRHFTRVEGVELPPDFPDFLYAALREALEKTGMFTEMVGENEVVDPADAPQSFILEGNLLEYGKGSKVKSRFGVVGYLAGRRTLRAHITVHRRSNNEAVMDQEIKVRAGADLDPKMLANVIAKRIADEVKKGLKP